VVGATGFEPATTCPQGPRPDFAPVAPGSIERQVGVSAALAMASEPLTLASIAPERGERTAPELRPADSAWLTPSDIAARLQVCRATVYKLCTRGELCCVRVGLSIRIAPGDLATFLARHRGALSNDKSDTVTEVGGA
jgi:excisionase family DNA binding protein